MLQSLVNSKPLAVDSQVPMATKAGQQSPVLIRLIKDLARRQDKTIEQLAGELGVTPGYLHQLSSGIKDIRNVSPHFIQAVAGALQLPAVLVMMLAGVVKPADWLAPSQHFCVAQSIRAQDMINDPLWSMRRAFRTDALDPEILSTQLCLYEAFVGCLGSTDGGTPRLLAHLGRLVLRVGLDQLGDAELEAGGFVLS